MNSAATPLSADEAVGSHGIAAVSFTVRWPDSRAQHEDRLFLDRFSVWREADILPPEIGMQIPQLRAGDRCQTHLATGDELPLWSKNRLIQVHSNQFDRHHRPGLEITPHLGRFYPQSFFQQIPGVFHDVQLPARIVAMSNDQLSLDINHPLARYPLEIEFQLEAILEGSDRRGGRCQSPLDDLLKFPGLAAPLHDQQVIDYGDSGDGMNRLDDKDDAFFYQLPRMVQHLDATARETLNQLYCRLLPADAELLDLMASHDSHLQGCSAHHIQLLGMNPEEMEANLLADGFLLHDLNAQPELPQPDNSFDAVICTASIEYLTQPDKVLANVMRVLRPGGVVIISFSNRWFPSKAIRIWSELHEFERVGMVTQWLQNAGFNDLHTFSSRGKPRPEDDQHANQVLLSDPIYAVWGYKQAE